MTETFDFQCRVSIKGHVFETHCHKSKHADDSKEEQLLLDMMANPALIPENYPSGDKKAAKVWLRDMLRSESSLLEAVQKATIDAQTAGDALKHLTQSANPSPESLKEARHAKKVADATQDRLINILEKHPDAIERIKHQRETWLATNTKHVKRYLAEWQQLLPKRSSHDLKTLTDDEWTEWMQSQPMTLWNDPGNQFGPVYSEYFINFVQEKRLKNLMRCFQAGKIVFIDVIMCKSLISLASSWFGLPTQILLYDLMVQTGFGNLSKEIDSILEFFLISMESKFKDEPPLSILPSRRHKTIWDIQGANQNAHNRGKFLKSILADDQFQRAFNQLQSLSPGNKPNARKVFDNKTSLTSYIKNKFKTDVPEWITLVGKITKDRVSTLLYNRVSAHMWEKKQFYKYLFWNISKLDDLKGLELVETRAIFFNLLGDFQQLRTIEDPSLLWVAFCQPFTFDDDPKEYAIIHGLKLEHVGWETLKKTWNRSGSSSDYEAIGQNWNAWRTKIIRKVFDRLYVPSQRSKMEEIPSTYFKPESRPKPHGNLMAALRGGLKPKSRSHQKFSPPGNLMSAIRDAVLKPTPSIHTKKIKV